MRLRLAAATVALLLATLAYAAPAGAATLWIVGDGGVAGSADDRLAERIEAEGPMPFDRFLYLGDVYETGTADEFANNYHPAFGRFKPYSSPTPGNHEWDNRAEGYDPYWGPLAPQNGGGHYYSFDVEGWHFVSLNTEEAIGASSPQIAWLNADLARYDGTCTVAFMHRPRYSAQVGSGDRPGMEPVWAALVGRGVAVFAGHHHNYQRFRPERGIPQFIVGTGGRTLIDVNESDPRLESSSDSTFGALRLRIQGSAAAYEYITTAGARLDSGSLSCRPHTVAAIPPPAPPAGAQGVLGAGRGVISIKRPLRGRTYRRLRSVAGAGRYLAGPVRLTLVRRAGRRCAAFNGRRLASTCRRPRALRARGRERWVFRLSRKAALPPGRYVLTARARGVDGRTASASARFRIR